MQRDYASAQATTSKKNLWLEQFTNKKYHLESWSKKKKFIHALFL